MMFNEITFRYFGRKGRTGKQGDGSLYQPPTSVILPPRNFSLITVPGGAMLLAEAHLAPSRVGSCLPNLLFSALATKSSA